MKNREGKIQQKKLLYPFYRYRIFCHNQVQIFSYLNNFIRMKKKAGEKKEF